MAEVSATEFNRNSGKILDDAMIEPVQINRNGRPKAVISSYEHYRMLEDFYWGVKAQEAEKNAQWLGTEATMAFLKAE